MGQVSFRKVAKNFGQQRSWRISRLPEKKNDERFRALFWEKAKLKYDGRALPKIEKNGFFCVEKRRESRKENCAMAYWMGNGKQLTDNEYEEYQRQQLEEQERVKQRTEALIQKLGQTYDELTGLLAQSEEARRQVAGETTKDKETYLRLKRRLELANMAPRCRWVKQGGTACGSPQMKKHMYCFAHMQMMEARDLMLRLPAPEDANAIQIGLMRIQKSLIEDTISTKKAGLLLYSMQLALTNVGRTTFGQAKEEEMVRNTVDEIEAIRQDLFTTEDTKDTEETQKSFTAKDAEENNQSLPQMNADESGFKNQEPFTTEGTEKNKGLPLMNADDSDLESEFVPVPGGYGFERVRLRIGVDSGAKRRPVQSVIAPEDTEIHANLG
jgi:hypothetical protein